MKKYQYLASWDDQTLTRVGEPVVVLGDSNVSQVEITLPSDFLLDPTKAECRMYFMLPGKKESDHDVLETATKDENGDSHVTWTIKHVHSQKGGRLAFSLTLIGDDAQWDSRTAIIPVYESRYQPESEEAEKPYTGRLDALEGSMAAIRGEFAEVQEDFEDLKETATLGTPIPESLVANMTEGHVYIYTGTEPGYTAGHVYYYVGGALTDGGVYGGTAVDATLTQSGQAADAKVTGDKIEEIKEDLIVNRIFMGADEYTYMTNTRSGITYEPTADKTRFHVYGTSTAGSFYNLYHNYTKLLDGINAGDKVYVIFNTSEHVFARIIFYASEQAIINTENIEYSRVITIPDNAVGMTVRYYVYTGYTPNVYVNVPIIVSYDKRSLFAPVFGNAPKYISFIDDDTTSDDLVTKYYNACMHNGVKGAYAVITGKYRNGDNDISLLKTYNYNGFNTLLHCESQYQYLNTTSSAFQRPRSIQNYTEAIRDFKNLDLVNPQNALVIPYGSYDNVAKNIAKDMGFDLAFSTRFARYNTTYEADRYALYRCGLSPIASVSDDNDATARGTMATCKTRVDELSNDNDGGWLIITTHFNEWTEETWDETLDSDGFPVGYARFNELVQYALSKGLMPISMAEGMAWMKKVLNKNEAISN